MRLGAGHGRRGHKVAGCTSATSSSCKKTTLDEAPALLQVTGPCTLLLFLGQNVFVHAAMTPTLVFELWIASFVLLFVCRSSARRISRASAPERCLVLGDANAIRTVRTKFESAGVNAKIVAGVRLDPLSPRIDSERFRELVCANEVHRVILAPVTTDASDTIDLFRVAKAAGVRVSLLPRLFEVVGSAVEFDHVDGLTMLGVRRFGLSRSSRALKRTSTSSSRASCCSPSAPLMAAVALAIRLDSRGPVLFRQTRVGRDGERFQIFKFRTMVPDAEALKSDLAHLNEAQGLFKIADDPRITRIGRSCAAPRSTSCRSCSTSGAAR